MYPENKVNDVKVVSKFHTLIVS